MRGGGSLLRLIPPRALGRFSQELLGVRVEGLGFRVKARVWVLLFLSLYYFKYFIVGIV